MTKIAQLTARYIAEHPIIAECLTKDVVNYSKLARQIAGELNIRQVSAVIAACRRYASSLRKKKEETGIDILKKSKKTIKVADKTARITFTINEKYLTNVLATLK